MQMLSSTKIHAPCSMGADFIKHEFVFSSEEFPVRMAHHTSAKYSKTMIQTVRERVLGPKKIKDGWNVDDNEILESFLELLQKCSDHNATSLKCDALVGYTDHVVRINLNAKQKGV